MSFIKRQDLNARAQTCDHGCEAGERGVRRVALGRSAQDCRGQGRHKAPRAFGTQSPNAPRLPIPNDAAHTVGMSVSHGLQMSVCRRIVLDPGEAQTRQGILGSGAGFKSEELLVDIDHPRAMGLQGLLKGAGLSKPAQRGDARGLGGISGQAMGLFVGHHLQPMLHMPKKDVCRREALRLKNPQEAFQGEGLEGFQRLRTAEQGSPSAMDQLLGLRKQLDIADPAPSELHVKSAIVQGRCPVRGSETAFDGVDVRNRGVIKPPSPDEGLKALQKRLSGG